MAVLGGVTGLGQVVANAEKSTILISLVVGLIGLVLMADAVSHVSFGDFVLLSRSKRRTASTTADIAPRDAVRAPGIPSSKESYGDDSAQRDRRESDDSPREIPQFATLQTVEGSHHAALAASFVSHGQVGAWGATRRGRRHVRAGIVREDAFAMSTTDQGVIVVVADGVGSTPDAHLAATTAATACAAFPWTRPPDRVAWRMTVNRALIAVQAALAQEVPACRDRADVGCPSTTLLMGLVTHHDSHAVVNWFSIGDSALIRLPRSFGASGNMEIVNVAPVSSAPTTAALPSRHPLIEEGKFEIDLEQEFLVLATDGCAKPIRQDPQLYTPDFLRIAESSADASHLLAAIQQNGPGFDDDLTAILVAPLGTVR